MRATRLSLVAVLVACGRGEPAKPAACPPTAPCPPAAPTAAAAPAAAIAPPAAAPVDCGAPTGANPVQTEMRRLECALQQAVAAIGRDDLPAIAHQLHIVHAAKEATAAAITAGTWAPATGDVKAFVALDEAFHRELEALVVASLARDHAATGAALGRTLGACQGCHAAYRPAPPAAPPAAPAAPHQH